MNIKRRILGKTLSIWESKKENFNIAFLNCVREISGAWEDITAATIINCFKKAGFMGAIWGDEDDILLSLL